MEELVLLEEFIKEALIDEARKKKRKKSKRKSKKKKRNPDYFRGTKKSNKQMDKEIKKCSGPNPPKSCYDYWSADKTYDKSKKKKKK